MGILSLFQEFCPSGGYLRSQTPRKGWKPNRLVADRIAVLGLTRKNLCVWHLEKRVNKATSIFLQSKHPFLTKIKKKKRMKVKCQWHCRSDARCGAHSVCLKAPTKLHFPPPLIPFPAATFLSQFLSRENKGKKKKKKHLQLFSSTFSLYPFSLSHSAEG